MPEIRTPENSNRGVTGVPLWCHWCPTPPSVVSPMTPEGPNPGVTHDTLLRKELTRAVGILGLSVRPGSDGRGGGIWPHPSRQKTQDAN